MAYRVFIVEDNADIATLTAENLRSWGIDAEAAQQFDNIDQQVLERKPDLVLLDISLPLFNGFHWCAQIRQKSSVPIVFISSRSDSMDIVMAMNMGGDDYITKPFSPEVLVAKVQAVLRRTYQQNQPQVLACRGAVLHIQDACLEFGGSTISLTKNEYRILRMLFAHKNQVVSREQLMRDLWESDEFIDDNTLTVNINRLRRHLKETGMEDLIETRKGLGYVVHD